MDTLFNDFVRRHNKLVCQYPTRAIHPQCKYQMVIVEPRKHPNFEFVCKVMLRFTNEQWGLHVFHGNQNEEFVRNCLRDIPNVKFTRLDKDNLNIPEYNRLLTSVQFYDQIASDTFVIFQTDSCLLKHGLDDYTSYDYIGAPWHHRGGEVGNGGFSLRKKDFCKKICQQFELPPNMNEDVFFAVYGKQIGANIPPTNVAQKFACESYITRELPIAVHKEIGNIHVPDLDVQFSSHFETYTSVLRVRIVCLVLMLLLVLLLSVLGDFRT